MPKAPSQLPDSPPAPLPMPRIGAGFIGNFEFEINFDATNPDIPLECVSYAVYLNRMASNAGVRMVAVSVQVKSEGESVAPLSCNALAMVRLEDLPTDIEPERADRHALAVAAPIAYGLVREQILTFTGRSPNGASHLPIVAAKDLLSNVTLGFKKSNDATSEQAG